MVDVLSDVLETLKFRGCLYFMTKFGADYGIQVPAYKQVARFHMVMQGTLWVRIDGIDRPLQLQSGEMILVPHGAPHVLSDQPDGQAVDLDQALEASGFDGSGSLVYGEPMEGRDARLVCGHFEFDESFRHPLLEQLPPYLLIRNADAIEMSWFHDALRFMAFEAQAGGPGASLLVKRLTDMLFIHAVRVWQKQGEGDQQFIGALADPNIGRSLQALHAAPQLKWTTETLAAAGGLSRTIFNDRFRELTGMTPFQYVTLWRMQRAQHLLRESRTPIDAIAEQVGYDSTAAFSRVFKNAVGTGPGKYRRDGVQMP